jgi:hypothetical protein
MNGHKQSGGQWNTALDSCVRALAFESSRKLVGIVSWYFDYHAATLQIDLTKYLTELRHQRQTVNAHGQPLTAWLVPRCSFSFAGLRHTIAQESAYSTPPRSPNPRQTWHRKRGRKAQSGRLGCVRCHRQSHELGLIRALLRPLHAGTY